MITFSTWRMGINPTPTLGVIGIKKVYEAAHTLWTRYIIGPWKGKAFTSVLYREVAVEVLDGGGRDGVYILDDMSCFH